jgi:membrane-bound lytic murein transglycosylase A
MTSSKHHHKLQEGAMGVLLKGRLRGIMSLASLAALSACSGGFIPPASTGAQAGPPPAQDVQSDVAANQPTVRTAPPPIPAQDINVLPNIQIVAATPITPIAFTPTTGTTSKAIGIVAGPSLDSLGLSDASLSRALTAFQRTCPALLRREDLSGLTLKTDWQSVCSTVATWPKDNARVFFTDYFDVVQVGNGQAFATGYYEPEIEGSRDRRPGYEAPIYKRPSDLMEIDLGQFSDSMKGKKIRGQMKGNQFVPYMDRKAIVEGGLAGRGLELAWAKDPVKFFSLQVQGSGRLRLPDGKVMQIGYDSQNGRDYTGIGKVMRERGLLQPGKARMQDIEAWLRANPDQANDVMNANKSWVFFRELDRIGAVGALNTVVIGQTTVAADPMFTPLGAPVVLSMDRADANGLWVAQDTGGAIKGPNRFDTFWGAGLDAEARAGGMSAKGTAFLLLPKGVLNRVAPVKP